jgi:anti-anti-sigma regulatory factor
MELKMEGPEKGILCVKSPFTLQEAGDLKEKLWESLRLSSELVIDLEEVKEIDLACLQLLCSAHRTAVLLGKQLVLTKPPQGFRAFAAEAGFSRHVNCVRGGKARCLWQGEVRNEQEHYDRG